MHDSHVHIGMSPLRENIHSDIDDFLQLNGKKILAQTTEYSDYDTTIELRKKINQKYGDIVDLGIGLHPSRFEEGILRNELGSTDIFIYAQKQYDIFEEHLLRNISEVSAIGECGLDYFGMYEYNQFNSRQMEEIKEVQRRIFTKICKLSIKYDIPLSIHSRDIQGSHECTKDTLKIISREGKGAIRGSFHSYTGKKKMLEEILNLGMYIGFNGIITYPSGDNVRDILRDTPLDRILFETDGPFLPTQSVRKNKKALKKYGRPALISEIIEEATLIKGTSYKRLEEISDQNYITLFKKKD